MKVFTSQAAVGRSLPVRCYSGRIGEIERVNVFIQGMSGDTLQVEALLPDGSDWVPVSTDTPIDKDGLYVVDAGANILAINVTARSAGTINAWIEPDDSVWRDLVRNLVIPS